MARVPIQQNAAHALSQNRARTNLPTLAKRSVVEEGGFGLEEALFEVAAPVEAAYFHA